MFYEIIKDEEELDKFIEWLPNLEDGQKFYVSLFARKKWGFTEGLTADKNQLKRFTCKKEDLKSKLRKLEIKLGEYTYKDVKINNNSLGVYITPNPRDMHKAGLKTAKEIISMVADGREIFNPQAIALNQIQTSGVKKYFDIDIDVFSSKLDYNTLIQIIKDREVINLDAIEGNIVQTRGGFHIMVDLNKVNNPKTWYNNFIKLKCVEFDVTMNADNMIPLPGCVQADFIPKLIK